ncbi:MAG: triose-phosphate isomerase [Candidatus Pacebacteria bacterium]|nr:triose-phosphate isomerase [Candidatus Paceibacterota bacterium]
MPSKPRRFLVGNWKMNPQQRLDAQRIVAAYKSVSAKHEKVTVIACPPFIYIPLVTNDKSKAKNPPRVVAGAQDVFYESEGAFTGETSAKMLSDMGVSHVIVGHSERRKLGETDEIVSKKVLAAVSAGLCPIVCIGEASRDVDGAYLAVIKEQIKNSLAGIPKSAVPKMMIAYEPVWAIGGKEAMKPEQVRETALFIKKIMADIFDHSVALDLPILYGGSVNWRNAGDILTAGGVQGFLVGRESINVPGFIELAKAVEEAA